MASFKFVHCADLHLGSRFEGITAKSPEQGRIMTESVFESFDRIADLASKEADLMVISGDIFDERFETPQVRYRFAEALGKAKVPCFICLGNHDHVQSWTESIPYPGNVRVFGKDHESFSVDIRGSKVEVVGRSFPDIHSRENPTAGIRGKDGIFSIAVLHGSMESSDDSDYAPCRLSDAANKGIDYWAMGHIHKRQVMAEHPHVVYPGNIQGRNRKERGEKGAYLVTVTDNTVSELKFVPTQSIIWKDEEFDITGKDLPQLMGEIRSKVGRGCIARIILNGHGHLDAPLRLGTDGIAAQIESTTGSTVSEIVLHTFPVADRDAISEGRDLRSMIVRASDDISKLGREELIELICKTKTSPGFRYVVEWFTDDELRTMVRDAETLLLEKLAEASR